MTIVYKLRELFYFVTLCCCLTWMIQRYHVAFDRGVITSIVPIRAIYGKGYYWTKAGKPNELPFISRKGDTWEVFVSARKVTVETCLGRREL
jgi:hypothetical protein